MPPEFGRLGFATVTIGLCEAGVAGLSPLKSLNFDALSLPPTKLLRLRFFLLLAFVLSLEATGRGFLGASTGNAILPITFNPDSCWKLGSINLGSSIISGVSSTISTFTSGAISLVVIGSSTIISSTTFTTSFSTCFSVFFDLVVLVVSFSASFSFLLFLSGRVLVFNAPKSIFPLTFKPNLPSSSSSDSSICGTSIIGSGITIDSTTGSSLTTSLGVTTLGSSTLGSITASIGLVSSTIVSKIGVFLTTGFGAVLFDSCSDLIIIPTSS